VSGPVELTPDLARHMLDRMGSTGQPPERGALLVNVATEAYLEVLRDEYLRPMRTSGRNSTFKLVQAPFGGGKTQFLHCLRELAWTEGFATALVGLSPKECPFDRPVSIYKEVALRVELPVADLEEAPSQGLDHVLRQLAELRVDEELLGDYLRGEELDSKELARWRLRERLDDTNAFRWLRSMAQCLSALGLPGVVLMFDEMDRNMSLSVSRRRAMGDNLRQMIDYCGQSLLPGVVWCYAVPPEFMDTIVPEYPALAQRLKGAAQFARGSPLQPVIDLDHLPLGATALLEAIGLRLLEVAECAHDVNYDRDVQGQNVRALARELGERQFESGTRRQFVKAVVSMIDAQRRQPESVLSAEEVRGLAGAAAHDAPATMAGETDF
jgi:hypothetical protein